MIPRHLCLALAAAGLLAACGGGSETAAPSQQNSKAPLRDVRPASSIVTSAQAAELLLNAAEGAANVNFPRESSSGTRSFAPFLYRYYASTNTYLGVVITPTPGYTLRGVYVAGPAFGNSPANPFFAGLVTDFLPGTVIDDAGSPSPCYDLALADTQGTHIVVEYSSGLPGKTTVETSVGALTTFDGHNVRETTVSSTAGGADDFTLRTFSTRFSDAVTEFGSEIQYRGGIVAGDFVRTVYTPAFVRGVYSLAGGAFVTEAPTGTAVTTTGTGQTTAVNVAGSTTTKFVGIESVTVPAGTYSTCKLEVTTSGSSVVATNWLIAGKGIRVKTISGGQTTEATSVKLNGASL